MHLSVETLSAVTEEASESARLIDHLLPELPDYLNEKLDSLTTDVRTTNTRIFTTDEKAAFIRAFVMSKGAFLKSCAQIKGEPRTVYNHLRRDPEWANALSTAKLSLGEGLQSHLHKLAMKENGTLATLALLKNRYFPKVYRESAPNVQVGIAIGFLP